MRLNITPPGSPLTKARSPFINVTTACSFPVVQVRPFASLTISFNFSPRLMIHSILIGALFPPAALATETEAQIPLTKVLLEFPAKVKYIALRSDINTVKYFYI